MTLLLLIASKEYAQFRVYFRLATNARGHQPDVAA